MGVTKEDVLYPSSQVGVDGHVEAGVDQTVEVAEDDEFSQQFVRTATSYHEEEGVGPPAQEEGWTSTNSFCDIFYIYIPMVRIPMINVIRLKDFLRLSSRLPSIAVVLLLSWTEMRTQIVRIITVGMMKAKEAAVHTHSGWSHYLD